MTVPPAGVHALGYWEEADTNPVDGVATILAPKRDADTGEVTLLQSDTPCDSAIIEAFRVERGSGPAVMKVGQTMREVKHTDPSSLSELESRGREPIDELEQLGLVELVKVSAETNSGDESLVDFDLRYKDLTLPTHDPKQDIYSVPRARRA